MPFVPKLGTMYFLAYMAFIVTVALYYGYQNALENAAAYWSRRLTDADERLPPDMHRYLKPRGQDRRGFVILWVSLIGLMSALGRINVIIIALCFFVLFTLRNHCWRLFPREDAEYFRKVFVRHLEKEQTRAGAKGDTETLEIIQRSITGLRSHPGGDNVEERR